MTSRNIGLIIMSNLEGCTTMSETVNALENEKEVQSFKNIISNLLVSTYAKKNMSKKKGQQRWNKRNTQIFEKLLYILGTDFAMIADYFRQFTNNAVEERVLRNKYKREYSSKNVLAEANDELYEEIMKNLAP